MIIFSSQEITNSTHGLIIYKFKYTTKSGTQLNIDFWDTAGQERFRTITQTYYRGANVIFLVFDATDINSFKNIPNWYKTFWNIFHSFKPRKYHTTLCEDG